MNGRISTVVNQWPSTKVGTKFFDGTHWTQCDYGDLRNDIKLTSEFFLKLTGGGKELLGFCISPCLCLPALILSATLSSCPFVFLNNDPECLSTTLLRKLGLRWLLVDDRLVHKCFKFHGSLEIRSQQFSMYENLDAPENVKVSDREIYIYATTTSGSTGAPKVVRVPGESILPNVLDFSFRMGLTSTDGILLSTALTFDPAILEFFLAVINGAPLIIVSKDVTRNPLLLLRAFKDGGAAFYQTTPSLFKLWNLELKRQLLGRKSCLRVLVLGGERFPALEEVKRWNPKQNVRIYNTYGVSEVSCWASLNLAFPNNGWKNFSEHGLDIGESLSETQLITTKDSSSELHSLMIGSSTRICAVENETFGDLITGNPVFRFTGDLFKIFDGKYYFCHRDNTIVKRLGKKVNVSWIEEKGHELGLDCAVSVKSSNNSADFRLIMFVVGNKDSKKVLDRIQSLKQMLPGDHWPDVINFVDHSLPLSSHGKLDRNALEAMDPVKPQRSKSNIATFVEFWNAFTIGAPTNEIPRKGFVASGGNSFTAILFINSLKDAGFPEKPNLLLVLLKDEPFQKCWATLLPKKKAFQRRKRKLKDGENNQQTENQGFKHTRLLKNDVNEARSECQTSVEVVTEIDIVMSHDKPQNSSTDDSKSQVIAKPLFSDSNSSINSPLKHTQLENDLPSSSISMALKGRVWPQSSLAVDAVWTSDCRSIRKLWSVDLNKCIDASPLAVISNNCEHAFIIIGSHYGLVAVLKCNTGDIISQTQLPDRVEASACLSSDQSFYYIGCYDGHIYRICVCDGKIVWSFKTQDQVKSTCVLYLNKLFVGSYDRYMYALTEGGDAIWKQLVGPVTIPVLPFESSIIVGTLSNTVWRLNASDGSVLCKIEIASPLFANIVHTKNPDNKCCIMMAPVDGPFQWRDVRTLQLMDTLTVQGQKFASPVVSSDGLTIIASDKTIRCQRFLSTIWSREFEDRIVSTPFVIGLRIVVITVDGTLHLLDDKGALMCTYKFPGEVFSSPVVVGSRVFVGCRDNNFYCLNVSR